MAHSRVARSTPRSMNFVGPEGVTTAVHDFGGDGPLLLFAHATGMHGWVWKPVADHLAGRARCVAIDLRGHGDSALPSGADLSWDGFGRDVLAAVAGLGSTEVIGIGHSLGGAALMMAELEAPGTFQRLFLYEPAVHPDIGVDGAQSLLAARDLMVAMATRRRATFPSRDAALANYVSKPPMAQFQAAVLAAYVRHGFADVADEPGDAVVLKCRPEIEAGIYAASYDHGTGERFHAITCPVTFAAGSATDALHHRTVDALSSQLGSSPVVLEGLDHFGPLQQPKQFADAVARHVLNP